MTKGRRLQWRWATLVALLVSNIGIEAKAESPLAPLFRGDAEENLARRFETLFGPLRTDLAALSPDGRRVAYSWREDDELAVRVVEVAAPEVVLIEAKVSNDGLATPPRTRRGAPAERTAARLVDLEWLPSGRLVGSSNRYQRERGLFTLRIDARDGRRLIAPRWADASRFLLAPKDEAAVRVRGRGTYYRAQLGEGRFVRVSEAEWQDAHRAETARRESLNTRGRAIEAKLQAAYPEAVWRAIEADATGANWLVRDQAEAEPGAFWIYSEGARQLREIIRCAGPPTGHVTTEFEVVNASAENALGWLTLPREPRTTPPSVVVLFPTRPLRRTTRGYDSRVRVLAELGYAVMQVGTQLHSPSPRDGEVDSKAEKARLQWAWHALETVRRGGHVLDHRRVIVMGERDGGYGALRAAQLFPEQVRAVVAIEPYTSLKAWYAAGKGGPVTQPMLVMSVPPPPPLPRIGSTQEIYHGPAPSTRPRKRFGVTRSVRGRQPSSVRSRSTMYGASRAQLPKPTPK